MENPYTTEALLKHLPNFTSKLVKINNIQLHYIEGGFGQPLILIPGYPETWWAYRKIMPSLALKYRVIVLEMRGIGESDKPGDGYDKKNMANDVFQLINHLEIDSIVIGGHDIGAHVAYSFAANFPEKTDKLILLDTPHPDASMYQLPMLPIIGADYLYPWWLAFNQVKGLPEQLLEGRMQFIIEWMFSNLLKDQNAVTEFDKAVYSQAYNTTAAIMAANSWYQAFPYDIEDMKSYNKLQMPILAIGGNGYEMLARSLQDRATNIELVKLDNCGHYIISEKPQEVLEFVIDFINR